MTHGDEDYQLFPCVKLVAGAVHKLWQDDETPSDDSLPAWPVKMVECVVSGHSTANWGMGESCCL